jgi:hypothetical protein
VPQLCLRSSDPKLTVLPCIYIRSHPHLPECIYVDLLSRGLQLPGKPEQYAFCSHVKRNHYWNVEIRRCAVKSRVLEHVPCRDCHHRLLHTPAELRKLLAGNGLVQARWAANRGVILVMHSDQLLIYDTVSKAVLMCLALPKGSPPFTRWLRVEGSGACLGTGDDGGINTMVCEHEVRVTRNCRNAYHFCS